MMHNELPADSGQQEPTYELFLQPTPLPSYALFCSR